MKTDENEQVAPAWSTPREGRLKEWVAKDLRNFCAGATAIIALGVVWVSGAALGTAWPLIGIGSIGTIALVRHRRKGQPFWHALWVASFFTLLFGLCALPFCFFELPKP